MTTPNLSRQRKINSRRTLMNKPALMILSRLSLRNFLKNTLKRESLKTKLMSQNLFLLISITKIAMTCREVMSLHLKIVTSAIFKSQDRNLKLRDQLLLIMKTRRSSQALSTTFMPIWNKLEWNRWRSERLLLCLEAIQNCNSF